MLRLALFLLYVAIKVIRLLRRSYSGFSRLDYLITRPENKISKMQVPNLFLSETTRPAAFIFGIHVLQSVTCTKCIYTTACSVLLFFVQMHGVVFLE